MVSRHDLGSCRQLPGKSIARLSISCQACNQCLALTPSNRQGCLRALPADEDGVARLAEEKQWLKQLIHHVPTTDHPGSCTGIWLGLPS